MQLKHKLKTITVDLPHEIPWIVRVLENPQSFLALPGKIELFNHDCLHVLLDKDLSSSGEAFVIGFCMGNDPLTKSIHLKIFRFASCYLYPKKYKFYNNDFIDFQAGFEFGQSLSLKGINSLDFHNALNIDIETLRKFLGIEVDELISISRKIKFKKINQSNTFNYNKFAKIFVWSSSFFAVCGGFILALNTNISSYGFILLACSSFQMLISACIKHDKTLILCFTHKC